MSTEPAGPLQGLIVIDASTVVAGPLAAALLGDYGARVIKVEHPKTGDSARHLGRPYEGLGSWWTFYSRNKECISCDLSKAEGAALFRRLTRRADLLIENFRPGKLESWGLAPSSLLEENPTLVVTRISGFGQSGPYANRPGYGTVVEAMSGFVHLTGFPDGPPTLPGVPIADSSTAGMAAFACMVGLHDRQRNGRGTVIDLALYGAMLQAMGSHLVEYERNGVVEGRTGNRMGTTPRNAHVCRDGKWITYSGASPNLIAAIVDLLDVRSDPRFATPETAAEHGLELDDLIGDWIARRDRTEVLDAFVRAGIPIGPVNDDSDVMRDEHFLQRGEFGRFIERGRDLRMAFQPFRLSDYERPDTAMQTSGDIGQDNRAVYRELAGVTDDELDDLEAAGVI